MGYTEEYGYQGWKNRATWNVALWIGNDYRIYCVARGYRSYQMPYASMRQDLEKAFGYRETKDGISLWDKSLDIQALDKYIREC